MSNIQISNAIMLLGVAATFCFFWLRHQKRWAVHCRFYCTGLRGAQFIIGNNFINRWPIFLLAAGIICWSEPYFLTRKISLSINKNRCKNKNYVEIGPGHLGIERLSRWPGLFMTYDGGGIYSKRI